MSENLLDYADQSLINSGTAVQEPEQQELGQSPMIDKDQAQDIARQASINKMNKATSPIISQGIEEENRAKEQNQVQVDPELIFEGNAEKFGKSLVAGTGIVVSDIGNMIDYAAMTILPDDVRKSDTFLKIAERLPSFSEYGDALQNWGKVNQSPGLDEFTLDDMFKMEFWATDVAKTLPYMASMIIPGTQGAGIARGLMTAGVKRAAKKGLFGSAKRLHKLRNAQKSAAALAKGSSKAVAGGEAALGGKGLMGAIAQTSAGEVGLTSFGTNLAGFLGSGTATTAVIGAGLAGDVYNRALDMGLSEEEAQTAAHGTFVDSSKWFLLNATSYGIQFGGLSGKAFKHYNKLKGGAESAKAIQKTFGQRLKSHASKGLAVGTFEGTEEMFQETYETWIQDKNLAEVKGEEFISYTDFLTSDENRKTLGVSFAAGFLMGGRGGFMDSVAENGRRITNKRKFVDDTIGSYDSMSDAQKKIKTAEIIEAAVREDNVDQLNGFLDQITSKGKISSEERAEYDSLITEYSEIAATLPFQETLSEAGQITLFNLKVKQNQNNKAATNLESLKNKNIQEANDNLEGPALESKLAQIEGQHEVTMGNLNKEIEENKGAVSKLLTAKKHSASAKKADQKRVSDINEFVKTEEYTNLTDGAKTDLQMERINLNEKIKEDSYIVDEAAVMSEAEFEQFTKEGAEQKAVKDKQAAEDVGQKAQDVAEKVVDKTKDAAGKATDKAKEASKGIFSKAKSLIGKTTDYLKKFVSDTKTSQAIKKVTRPIDAEIQKMVNEDASAEQISEFIMSKATDQQIKDSGLSKDEFKTYVDGLGKTFTKLSTEESLGEDNKAKELTSITDEVYKEFVETGKVDDSVISYLAEKLIKGESFTDQEQAIRAEKAKEVEAYINKAKLEENKNNEKPSNDAPVVSKKAEVITEEENKSILDFSKNKIKSILGAGKSLYKKKKKAFTNFTEKQKKSSKENKAIQAKYPDSPTVNNKSNLNAKLFKENEKESVQSTLAYYASINPITHGIIIEAASKKFPDKQLLILKDVIDEHGELVAGYSMGSAVLAKEGSNLREIVMHEYGHVYYDMLKNNPSFIRGVSKIINTSLYKRIKKQYSEEVLYSVGDKVLKGQDVFAQLINSGGGEYSTELLAFLEANKANDQELAGSIAEEIMLKLEKDKVISPLADEMQEAIIEEAFVTSLAPQLVTKLDSLFEKPAEAKAYKSFVKRTGEKIANLFTPSDSKKILESVDRSFESLTIDEMYERIAKDFTDGTFGGGLKYQQAQNKKYKLNKTFSASIAVAFKGLKPSSVKNMSSQEIAKQAIIFASLYSKSIGEDIKLTKELREEVEARASIHKQRLEGFSFESNKGGVGSIYDAAGMSKIPLTKQEQADQDFQEIENLVDDQVNILSDDASRIKAMDNSTSKFIAAIMKIANPNSGKEGGVRYSKAQLEAQLLKMAHNNRDNDYGFIKAFRQSTDANIKKAREIMEQRMEPGEFLTALTSIHNNYRNKFIESITQTTITSDGSIVESLALASSEKQLISSMVDRANDVFFKSNNSLKSELLNRIKNAQNKLKEGKSLSKKDALNIAIPILRATEKNRDYIDYDALESIRLPKGNRIVSLEEYVTEIITDETLADKKTKATYLSQGKIPVQNMTELFKGAVVLSRNKNAIKSVVDVNGNTTLALNYNNSLLNTKQDIINRSKTEEGRESLKDEYLRDYNGKYKGGNPFVEMAVSLGARGLSEQSLNVSFDGGIISYSNGNAKSIKYEEGTKDDIVQFDMEKFASNWDGRKPSGGRSYYTQPIAIFANSKRRYSVSSPMYTTEKQKSDIINSLVGDSVHLIKYKDGTSPVAGLNLTEDGKYDISEEVNNLIDWIKENPALAKDNPVLSKFVKGDNREVSITPEGEQMLNDYVFNYIVNSYYSQNLFVGAHESAKSEKDYIKRATGAAARHDGALRGVAIEPLIYNDVVIDGIEATDAGSFILPEDVRFISSRVGEKIGEGYKFVYYGNDKRSDSEKNNNPAANFNVSGEDFYFKTYMQVLHPEFIGESKELQKIADDLRARRQFTANGETLNIAMFASAAKRAPQMFGSEGSESSGVDINEGYTEGSENWNTLNSLYMQGDKLVGLDGANMGIQLPMDQDRNEISNPTQLSAANNSDLSPEAAEQMDKIIMLEQQALDLGVEESLGEILSEGIEGVTQEQRAISKKAISDKMSKTSVGQVFNGLAKYVGAKNPALSQNLPSLISFFGNGVRSMIKKSSRILTSGNIAIQGVAVGRNLKAFKHKGKEYLGDRYEVQKDGSIIKKPSILPAEAIVPAGLKGKYFARVDKEFANRSEAVNYADSLVKETPGSTNVDTSGVRIQGLNRKFPSVRAAKEFLYNKIAIYDGKHIILGDEFMGSRIPAHGQQSRIIMEVKGFQKEVLGSDGKHKNNHIQVSHEVNRILGSDHDGDSIFMNFPYESPKSKREEVVNEMLDAQMKFFRGIENFEHLSASMEYENDVEARIEKLNKRFPNKKKRSPQSSPIGASQFFEENVQGGSMIGTIAALNNGMTYFSRYNVGLGIKEGITINGKTVNEFSNDITKKGVDSLSFKNAVLLNIALDNTKNQYATTLGMNPATVSAVALANRLGFNTEALDVLFTSEAARLYSKYKGKKALKDNTYINTTETSAAVLAYMDLFPGTKPEQARAALSNNSKFGININTDLITGSSLVDMSSEEKSQMVSILSLLNASEGITKDVYAINNLMGQAKNVGYNVHEVLDQKKVVEEIFNGEGTVDGDAALNSMKMNPVVRHFMEKLDKTAEIYESNNFTATNHAKNTFSLIKKLTGNNNITKRDGDKESVIFRDYLVNVMANTVPMFKKTLQHTGNFAGRNPEPKVNKVIRNLEATLFNQDLNENLFIKAVDIKKYEGFKDRMTTYAISPNVDYINEHTNENELTEIKQAFNSLPVSVQEDFFIIDSILNEVGNKNTTVQNLFSNQMLAKLSEEIDVVHQEVIDGLSDVVSEGLVAESIIMKNPNIIPTGMSISYNNKVIKGGGEMKRLAGDGTTVIAGKPVPNTLRAVSVANESMKSLISGNQEHFVKVYLAKENVNLIYKFVPGRINSKLRVSDFEQAKTNGKYRLYDSVGKTSKKKNVNIENYLKAQSQENAKSSLVNSKKMKFYDSASSSSAGMGINEDQKFTFEEYLEDKGHSVDSVMKNSFMKESLEKLYKSYISNFNLAQEFDRSVIQTGRIKTLSIDKLNDYALMIQKLDPSAISSIHKAIVLELAMRASEAQKASRNGIEWTDKGDISWLHAWFGSNNVAGHRPEIQNLVRTMEKEYGKFMEENIKFQKELDRLTKNLVRDKIADNINAASKGPLFIKWFMGSFPSWSGWEKKMYEKMYDKVEIEKDGVKVSELKLKTMKEFLALNPSKAEVEFYTFFKGTTNKYGKITKDSLGERYKENYIPHIKMGALGSIKQRGVFGLYDYMLQGTGDINHVKVKGINPTTGNQEILPFHQWQLIYYTTEGNQGGIKQLFKGKQYKAAAKLDVIRKRAESLAKSGKHDDGTNISMSEQEVHGTLGTNLMSRFSKSRGVKTAMFAGEDLGLALSQYVNTTLFTYGNENFSGFKSMSPLLDGVIEYNKKKGNKNAVTYLENVWKKGFYNMSASQTGLGRLTDNAIHQLVKMTRLRFLSLSSTGGVGNLMVGKYNEFRSKGGKKFAIGETRYWGQRKKAWALIKAQLNPESFAYDLIQGNDSSGFNSLMMAPYIGSEHYIQGSGFVSQFTKEEWDKVGEDGSVPAELQEKVDLYVENVVRQQGYGYSKVDQVGIATYSWGKAIMQFKKWMPTAVAERFSKDTIDRFGVMRSGSNRAAFAFGSDFARKVIAGEQSVKDFKIAFKALPKERQEAVKTFFRGMQVVSALSILAMMFGDSDDEELRGIAKFAGDTRDDIMFMTDPRRIKFMAEPASWSLVESGATMAVGAATMDKDKFKGGLSGISWTASQVLNTSESAAKNISEA